MAEGRGVRYELAPGCSWVVEERGVVVLDELAREGHALGYPEAAIWELLLRGHDVAQAAAMLRWIGELSPEAALELVARWAAQWVESGWLRAAA